MVNTDKAVPGCVDRNKAGDRGSSVRVPEHSALTGPNLKCQRLKRNKSEEGDEGGEASEKHWHWKNNGRNQWCLGQSRGRLMIADSLQLFGESYANTSTFILCSPAAQEPRSVCRNYKQAVFKPNVKHKRVFKSLQLSHKRKGCSKKKKKNEWVPCPCTCTHWRLLGDCLQRTVHINSTKQLLNELIILCNEALQRDEPQVFSPLKMLLLNV